VKQKWYFRRKNKIHKSLELGNYHYWWHASNSSYGWSRWDQEMVNSTPHSAAHYQHLQVFPTCILLSTTFPSTKSRKRDSWLQFIFPHSVIHTTLPLPFYFVFRFLTSICTEAQIPFLSPSLNCVFLAASDIFRERHLISNHLPWPHTFLQSFFHLAWNPKKLDY